MLNTRVSFLCFSYFVYRFADVLNKIEVKQLSVNTEIVLVVVSAGVVVVVGNT